MQGRITPGLDLNPSKQQDLIQTYTIACQMDPKNSDYHNNLGLAFYNRVAGFIERRKGIKKMSNLSRNF